MQLWEYEIVQVLSAGVQIRDVLAEWGRGGWELAGVVLSEDGRFATLFFKRPVP
jgi:hypothetical protein